MIGRRRPPGGNAVFRNRNKSRIGERVETKRRTKKKRKKAGKGDVEWGEKRKRSRETKQKKRGSYKKRRGRKKRGAEWQDERRSCVYQCWMWMSHTKLRTGIERCGRSMGNRNWLRGSLMNAAINSRDPTTSSRFGCPCVMCCCETRLVVAARVGRGLCLAVVRINFRTRRTEWTPS